MSYQTWSGSKTYSANALLTLNVLVDTLVSINLFEVGCETSSDT